MQKNHFLLLKKLKKIPKVPSSASSVVCTRLCRLALVPPDLEIAKGWADDVTANAVNQSRCDGKSYTVPERQYNSRENWDVPIINCDSESVQSGKCFSFPPAEAANLRMVSLV